MWSSHLFRTFFRKVYRPNCQVFQGVQRFSKITASRPAAVSRTQRATNCATPRYSYSCFSRRRVTAYGRASSKALARTHDESRYFLALRLDNPLKIIADIRRNVNLFSIGIRNYFQILKTDKGSAFIRFSFALFYAFSSAKRCFISYMPAAFPFKNFAARMAPEAKTRLDLAL
jgi:hypothetical protein